MYKYAATDILCFKFCATYNSVRSGQNEEVMIIIRVKASKRGCPGLLRLPFCCCLGIVPCPLLAILYAYQTTRI